MLDARPQDNNGTSTRTRLARVLIVDDSAIVRQVLQAQLAREPGVEVVGTAADPFAAREKILALKPDCVVLDIEMPRMDGLTFLRKLMKFHPVPTIICSSVTPRGCALALECLEAGAFEVVSKPGGNFSVGEVARRLGELVRAAVNSRIARTTNNSGVATLPLTDDGDSAKVNEPLMPRVATRVVAKPAEQKLISPLFRPGLSDKLIAIGTSTGGTEALRKVLTELSVDTPPILMVQHMPEGFTKAFADRLNSLCRIAVKEAEDGDAVIAGRALLAPGSFHMRLVREGGPASNKWIVRVTDGPRVLRHKPSVEVLFESCAQYAGKKAMGVIMTGMGNDGAAGLLSMRKAGAVTVAQDEQSCVVYGMPREAALCGAAQTIAPLDRIAKLISDFTAGSLVAQAA
ncbi:MAG: chemotaxis response regulator protein-glutamate methylesterase [Planctomycetota bacterium]|nr:MAG: chemotaxis response regulator protein-glutamate methylesterase [Planctomycetota bacterium]RLS92065.1 MAG: chemotaxis response regulator protein-glutamate methylesterase [Planctomycetota bacterium]